MIDKHRKIRWTDQKLNYTIIHPSIAQYVREKYFKQYILLILIGQIGMVLMRNLYV